MSETPEDRGPSSLRIVKYDPANPVHSGLVERQRPNEGSIVNSNIDARTSTITMPVAPGMEEEPTRSGRHMTNEENENFIAPKPVDIEAEKKKIPKEKKDKVAATLSNAHGKRTTTSPKAPLRTESQKAQTKEELKNAAIARNNARFKK